MISLECNALYKPVFSTKARYVDIWGGRGRGGSHFGTQYALHLLTCPSYFRGYFMREIFGDIRESLWRDFKDRVEENETLNESDFAFNESQMTVIYKPTGNMIISKGFKKSSGNRTAKLKSLAGATHVFIEEFDEISEADFNQLDDSLRTLKGNLQVVRIFNPPPKGHWVWKRNYTLIDHPDQVKFKGFFTAIPKNDPSHLSIHSTYRDNLANLNESFIQKLLSYQSTDPDYYGIMVEGLISEGAKGRIYRNWQRIEGMPNNYEKFYGLDFGFTNDPVALAELEMHNKTVWIKEKIYETGMLNSELSARMLTLGISKSAKIYADSAEPKDIKDLKRLGWNIIDAYKGPVKSGISDVKEYSIFATEDSENLWHENAHYKWALDQHKNPTNEPIDEQNHLMDAIRYALVTKKMKPKGINLL
jgi:phage terminase large subunit